MQSVGIAHCDIKPENIFVANEGKALKIGDLGCVTETDRKDYTLVGIAPYLSPQTYQSYRKDRFARLPNHDVTEADVYSLGIVLLHMATLMEHFLIFEEENLQVMIIAFFNILVKTIEKLRNPDEN